jgi:hypothetical protein
MAFLRPGRSVSGSDVAVGMALAVLPAAAGGRRKVVRERLQHLWGQRHRVEVDAADANYPVASFGNQILDSVMADFKAEQHRFLGTLLDPGGDGNGVALDGWFAEARPGFDAWKTDLELGEKLRARQPQRSI